MSTYIDISPMVELYVQRKFFTVREFLTTKLADIWVVNDAMALVQVTAQLEWSAYKHWRAGVRIRGISKQNIYQV